MANHTKLKPIVLKWEGGYQTYDSAVCTMKGVTLATYQAYYGKSKTCEDLKKITDEQWDHIFKHGYWDKWKADRIECQSIANLVVDWVWASGKYGIIYPQRVLGVTADGIVGEKTLAAINNHPNKKELFEKLWKRREEHFRSLATGSRKAFLKGWLNRLNDFKWLG